MIGTQETDYAATMSRLEDVYNITPQAGDDYVDRAYRIYTHTRANEDRVSEVAHPDTGKSFTLRALHSLSMAIIIQNMKNEGVI